MKKIIVSILVIGCLLTTSIVSVNASIIVVESEEIEIEECIPINGNTGNDGEQADWTVIAYIDGDNNLNQIFSELFNHIEIVGSTQDVEIVVQFDRLQITTYRYHISYDGGSEVVDNLGELNMGESETLSDFVIWAIENYTADRYLVIICNHGYSWGGICIDQTNDEDYLSSGELKTAFNDINQRLKEIQPMKDHIDLVFFEACGMSSIELYYELKDCFDLGVSCEHSKAFHPVLFTHLLENLTQHPEWNQIVVAEKIAKDYYDYCINEGDEFEDDMEVIDPSNIENLIEKIDNLAVLLKDELPLYKNLIKLAALNTGYQFSGPGNINPDYCYIYSYDVYKFASNLKEYIPNTLIKNAAQDVMNAIDEVVIKWFSDYGIKRGLHIMLDFIPEDGPVPEEYLELDFAKDTEWDEFVNEFLDALDDFSYSGNNDENSQSNEHSSSSKSSESSSSSTTTTTTTEENSQSSGQRPTSPLFLRVLERFPYAFPILRTLLGL